MIFYANESACSTEGESDVVEELLSIALIRSGQKVSS